MKLFNEYLTEANIDSAIGSISVIKPDYKMIEYKHLQDDGDKEFERAAAYSTKTWLTIMKSLLIARSELENVNHPRAEKFNRDYQDQFLEDFDVRVKKAIDVLMAIPFNTLKGECADVEHAASIH